MKIAIMQPYFLPYIGYFQLINSVDVFVIYDTIEFTKKGWINRNRILVNNEAQLFSIPLKKDSDFLNVNQRFLSENWASEKTKLLNKIKGSYQKSPYYSENIGLFLECFQFENNNLFEFILHSVKKICAVLDIKTNIIVASSISINHELKSSEKVKAICKELLADEYINTIGGIDLYDKNDFNAAGIKLNFIKTSPFSYHQNNQNFIPFLSVLDLFMFNSVTEIKEILNTQFAIQ